MIVYRIGSRAYPLLDGGGAATSSTARWNSRGRFVVYCSEHYSTALLEKAAQLGTVRVPRTLVFGRIEIPAGASFEEVTPDALPHWNSDDRTTSQDYGDRWYDERRSLVLLVPSLAAPGIERNVLINQHHATFARIKASTPAPLICHPALLV